MPSTATLMVNHGARARSTARRSWRMQLRLGAFGGARRELSQLSYFHKPGKRPLLAWTLADVLDKTADAKGDNKAIVSCHQGITKTYTEYRNDMNQFAASLMSLNLPIGSMIGIMAPNLYEWGLVQFAAAKAGLVLVNINTAYQAPELEHCLNHTECEAVILSEKFARQDYYQTLLEIVPDLERSAPGELKGPRLPFLKHVILISDSPKPGTVTFNDLMKSATSADHAAMRCVSSKLQFDAAVNVQFTSGTTGQPKAALLSHFNMVNNANSIGRMFGLHEEDDSICLNVPLVHCYGCVGGSLAAAMFGATLVMPSPSFKAKAALQAIAEQRQVCAYIYSDTVINFFFLRVTTLLNTVGTTFQILYGCTETSPVITCSERAESTEQWIQTVGKPTDHVEVKIVDSQGTVVPVNQSGELCARGYLVFKGYLKQDDKTREVVRDNWYHTGDEATMSEDGRITIRGRIKDMIIRGGENIYPQEIENLIYTHSDVLEVQVVGVPDSRLGEEVCAWIILKPGKSLSEGDVKGFCKGKISYFKIPRYVLFAESFPKTVSGKIQKHKLRDESKKILNL
ncbi:hypothetical protein HPB47_008274 [Ixodes persulcatus]|uniref:Uncharacterized protein n=1 Tax=Ixodes persulcatus TaxID=34615 RepID=A0AC60P604_IXOPE|nr:hypothetical protein HPB47_008274 [Ixodes persulcatus]